MAKTTCTTQIKTGNIVELKPLLFIRSGNSFHSRCCLTSKRRITHSLRRIPSPSFFSQLLSAVRYKTWVL
ncbi:unnamed protein product [Arctia plantaginis]|uniref:Uncharacterized protein n=1 Tax=Arctia plantaginis TaxID=874455 RepID=A0A8S0ZKI6_ARCPL|nr:unnamed protein product [Arctia plantaginis]